MNTTNWDLVAALESGVMPVAPKAMPVRLGQIVKWCGAVATVFSMASDEIGQPVLRLRYLGTGRFETVTMGTLAALTA